MQQLHSSARSSANALKQPEFALPRRIARLVASLALAVATTVTYGQQHPTISLQAVKHNPTCVDGDDDGAPCIHDCDCDSGVCGGNIDPTNDLIANPGDVIVADFFAREWSPLGEGLRSWQVETALSLSGGGEDIAGDRGTLRVLEWPRCCRTSADCSLLSPTARCVAGACQDVPELFPYAGSLFIDSEREDYVFPGVPQIAGHTNVETPGVIRWAAVVFNPDDSPIYVPPQKYLATIALVVSDDSCGTFAVTMVLGISGTSLRPSLDPDSTPIGPVALENLTVTMASPECPCTQIIASDPPNCAIDARPPATGAGWNTFDLTYNCPDTTGAAGFEQYSVGSIPRAIPLTIGSIRSSGDHVSIELVGESPLESWTCIAFSDAVPANSGRVCFARLPGDVDQNSTTDPNDIAGLIDCVRRPTNDQCHISQCDMNRTDLCTPSDLLTLIDMLNGAGDFSEWNGATIPGPLSGTLACPSAGEIRGGQ